jgi:hypothetical protein
MLPIFDKPSVRINYEATGGMKDGGERKKVKGGR